MKNELSFVAGQSLLLAPKDQQPSHQGWLLASNGSNVGLIPANYIKILGLRSSQPQQGSSHQKPESSKYFIYIVSLFAQQLYFIELLLTTYLMASQETNQWLPESLASPRLTWGHTVAPVEGTMVLTQAFHTSSRGYLLQPRQECCQGHSRDMEHQ